MWLKIPTSHCSAATEDSISPSDALCQKLAASVSWRGRLLRPQSWRLAWKTEGWRRRLSGLTLQPSQANSSVAAWLDSLVGFPAKTVAGRQAGIDGERSGLFFEIVRLVRELESVEWLFLENVPPVLNFPAGTTVLGELAKIGFNAEWGTLRASDVGGSHKRERAFVLADASHPRLPEPQRSEPHGPINRSEAPGPTSEFHTALFPPGPADLDAWRQVPEHLHPAVEPGLRRLADGANTGMDKRKKDRKENL